MGVYLYPNNTETPLKNAYIWIPNPTSIVLNKSVISLTTVGQTEQLTATIQPTVSDKTITWSSDDPTVATVSPTWLVTCVTPWTCTITATTVNGLTASCSVAQILWWIRPSTLKGWYWKLNWNMDDSTWNWHTGSWTANYVTWHDGVSQAYDASSSSYYVSIPNSSELYPINWESFSFWFWIKPSYSSWTYSTRWVISMTQNIDWYRWWSIHEDGGSGNWQFRTNNWSLDSTQLSSLSWNSWEWFHFVLTYDGSTVRYYKNGVLLNSFSRTVWNCDTTYPLTIGYASTWSSSWEAIYEDAFYMKNYCLDWTEVATIYSDWIIV